MHNKNAILAPALAAVTLCGCAGLHVHRVSAPAVMRLDPACVRHVGGVSEFRREQFITLHEGSRP